MSPGTTIFGHCIYPWNDYRRDKISAPLHIDMSLMPRPPYRQDGGHNQTSGLCLQSRGRSRDNDTEPKPKAIVKEQREADAKAETRDPKIS